jgi:hypothetical protein
MFSDQGMRRKIYQKHTFPFWFLPMLFLIILGSQLIFLAACGNQNTKPAIDSSPAAKPQGQTGLPTSVGSGENIFGPFRMKIPTGWKEQTPASTMRKAQYSLSGSSGDAELAVFNFPGQGGSVEANIDRWIGQFTQPDGSPSKAKAKTRQKQVSGFEVTILDLSGTYNGGMMPGASESPARPGYRMIASVVATAEGPWFFKLVGPEKTVAEWISSLDQMLDSIQKK